MGTTLQYSYLAKTPLLTIPQIAAKALDLYAKEKSGTGLNHEQIWELLLQHNRYLETFLEFLQSFSSQEVNAGVELLKDTTVQQELYALYAATSKLLDSLNTKYPKIN